MNIFMVSASNAHTEHAVDNINSIQKAFNENAKIKGWRRASDAVWLVEASDDMTPSELCDVAKKGLAHPYNVYSYTNGDGQWCEGTGSYQTGVFVAKVDTKYNISLSAKGALETADWYELHLLRDKVAKQKAPQAKATPKP